MGSASYFIQTRVYFKKMVRIAVRENVWVFLMFALVISLLVSLIIGDDMFLNYEKTQSGFFTLASACIWIGVFNSIQSICKEHAIIHSDYRQGMRLSSYVSAHILWQALLCFEQSLIVFGVCMLFGFFGDTDAAGVFMNAYAEYFITIFLLTFNAAVLGLMVSSFSDTPTTAMKIMPFVLILQLIMSGVLFELDGAAEYVACITYSKWGMSAFGSIADLNSLAHALAKKMPDMAELIAEQYPAKACFDHEAPVLLASWLWCAGIGMFCACMSLLSLKLKNRNKN